MTSGERMRVHDGGRRGPSRKLVAAIVVPVLALLAFLIAWAFSVREWTWFSLLIAAAVGVSAFVISPDLFSINDTESLKHEWQVHTREQKVLARASSAVNKSQASKAPDKSA